MKERKKHSDVIITSPIAAFSFTLFEYGLVCVQIVLKYTALLITQYSSVP